MNIKPWIGTLRRYEPGRPVEEVARELGFADAGGLVKLASNENALGPSRRAVRAMKAAASGMHRYPDGGALLPPPGARGAARRARGADPAGQRQQRADRAAGPRVPGCRARTAWSPTGPSPSTASWRRCTGRRWSRCRCGSSCTTCRPCAAPSRPRRASSSSPTPTTLPGPSCRPAALDRFVERAAGPRGGRARRGLHRAAPPAPPARQHALRAGGPAGLRAAHLLEGLRPGRPAHRLRRRPGRGHRGAGPRAPAVQRQRHGPGRGPGGAGGRGARAPHPPPGGARAAAARGRLPRDGFVLRALGG